MCRGMWRARPDLLSRVTPPLDPLPVFINFNTIDGSGPGRRGALQPADPASLKGAR